MRLFKTQQTYCTWKIVYIISLIYFPRQNLVIQLFELTYFFDCTVIIFQNK